MTTQVPAQQQQPKHQPPRRSNATLQRHIWIQNPSRAGLLGWLFRYYCFAFLIGLLGLVGIGRGLYRHFADSLPSVELVENYRQDAPGISRVYAASGTLLTELAREHRQYLPLDEIPLDLQQAFLATEDRRFYEHNGLDFRGLARAVAVNLQKKTIHQGGSTISQQVAKSFLASHERTLARKIREAILTLRIESRLTKGEILEIYLNKIFLGYGAYGVNAASIRYFDRPPSQISLAESALLAGLARAPSRYSPYAHPERALKRRNQVLRGMFDAGVISKENFDEASDEPLKLTKRDDPFRRRAPAYAEEVRRILTERFGEEAVLHEGLLVESAVRLDAQQVAREALDLGVRKLDRRQGYRGPVNHLESKAARQDFIARMKQEYSTSELAKDIAPSDENSGHRHHRPWRLALVLESSRNEVRISFGHLEATIQLRHANWAAPYDRRSGVNDQKITDLRGAIASGDVIWARLRPTKTAPKDAKHSDDPNLAELGQQPKVEATLYTFDHQRGYVEAMIPGHDFDRSQFNRSTQSCRSPGSVFKAIYYGLALDTPRWRMDSILEAKPWEPEEGEEWNPRNIDKTVDGKVLLRTAFIKSLNTPSIRLFVSLGAEKVIEWTRRLGITTELVADKGLSLGASCTQIDELSRAFGVYARGGTLQDPVYLRRVINKKGETLLDQRTPDDPMMNLGGRLNRVVQTAATPPVQLIDERSAFLITRLLREVVSAGIGGRASQAGVPVAGKSGTASGRYKRDGKWVDLTTDTWFVGFTSQHVTSAWMGFDNRNERSIGDDDASYTTAIPMWASYAKRFVALLNRQHRDLPLDRPPGLFRKTVDATRGGPPVAGMPTADIYLRQGSESPP